MLRISHPRARLVRYLGVAATVTLLLTAVSTHRAAALTLINPAASPAVKAASEGMITEIRHGGRGGGRGGFHGGGHVRGFRGGGSFHAARVGGFRAAPAYYRGGRIGAYRYGGYRFAGHRYGHRHRYFPRRFHGGYYPYYYGYPRYHRCRIIWTYYGPRRVCRWPRWGYPYRAYW